METSPAHPLFRLYLQHTVFSKMLSNCASIIHSDGLSMRREVLVSQKRSYSSHAVPRKRFKLHMVAVVAAISAVVLTLLFTGFFSLEANVEIMTSTLHSGSGLSSNYRWVTVDAGLYNPGWSNRITVWAEITCQLTQTSYSKSQYVQIGFRESKEVKFDFTLDNAIDSGELTHRVWITYIEQD